MPNLGNLQIDYRTLPAAASRVEALGIEAQRRRAGAVAPAQQLALYAKDPLYTSWISDAIADIEATLAAEAAELQRLARRMEAVAKAAWLADQSYDGQGLLELEQTADLDPETALVVFLLNEGEYETAINASLFDPEDEIIFSVEVEGDVLVYKNVEAGLGSSVTAAIKLLPDRTYPEGNYQLTLSGELHQLGRVDARRNSSEAEATMTSGVVHSITFRGDPADIHRNATDVRTILSAPAAVAEATVAAGFNGAVEGAKGRPIPVLPSLLVLGGGVAGAIGAGKREARERQVAVDAALDRLAEEWDAVDVGIEASGSGHANVSRAKELSLFGQPLRVGGSVGAEFEGDGAIRFRHERHGHDEIVITQSVMIGAGGGLFFEADSPTGAGTAGAMPSRNAAAMASAEIRIDVETGRAITVVKASGQVGKALAHTVGLSPAGVSPSAPKVAQAGTDVDVQDGYEIVLRYDTDELEPAVVAAALESGDFDTILKNSGLTEASTNEKHLAEVSASTGLDVQVASVSAGTSVIVDDGETIEAVDFSEPNDPPDQPAPPDFPFTADCVRVVQPGPEPQVDECERTQLAETP